MTSLTQLEELTLSGREDEARQSIDTWDTSQIRDAMVHLRVADLCEELGLPQRVIAELNYAVRDNPEEHTVLRRLGQAHLDAGRSDRALRCYQILTDKAPHDPQNWLDAIDLLLDMERREDALRLALKGQELCPHREIQARIRSIQSRPEAVTEEQEIVGTNSPALLARFVSLFAGREGVYARQWAKNRQNTGYTPIREPFTHRVAQNHVQGNHTVGIYPVRLDGTVLFAALDLDLQRNLVLRHEPGDAEWQEAMQRLHDHAWTLIEQARQRGLCVYWEDSGGKGRHLWCFFAQPIAARVARRFCQLWLQWGGHPPQGVSFELYPKQAQVAQDQLGNLIKLPLGIHRGTGRRGEFLDDTGHPHEDQETFLMTVERNSKEALFALLQQSPVSEMGWVEEAEADQPLQEEEILKPLYQPQNDLEFQTLTLRCATLRALYDQACHQNSLTHDQAQVVQHTMGYLRMGVEAANHVFGLCPDIGAHYYLKSPLRGNPMSCARIRARIPATTSQLPCNCEFAPGSASYPTPLIHLRGEVPEDSQQQMAQAMAMDYAHALAAWKEAGTRLERIQKALLQHFEGANVEELATDQGTLRLSGDRQQLGCLQMD